ncbi:uncharacterized protein A1O5_13268 [Cladophialophora psammophila CBS 110553]|uniref:(S)-ureidoglycine aminohydrolase cupin domain-containing protein n=1 Tax=Cladophialophora psammophila CBS 110553 TaxID=1182543 RepID=W9VD05_9EURO|nr:uncharacterized protein A1O5_13268 [Cladophialophora psammophila CBS 110553]EXJ53492.1 hypothetical protein A1O5_13268 [Cladophialophora psammophila CBS 110553]
MPPSVPNLSGSSDPATTPYGHHTSFPWEPLPQPEGYKSVIYRSSDGKIVVAAAKETGMATFTYPCDEFFFVTNGWLKLKIQGGDEFTLSKGDFIYLKKGTTADFHFSPDFSNVAVFIGDEAISLV